MAIYRLLKVLRWSLSLSGHTMKGGQVIETVGDAASYFGTLTEEKREHGHWRIAVRMLNHALDQPAYLKTATMSLQTALVLDGLCFTSCCGRRIERPPAEELASRSQPRSNS